MGFKRSSGLFSVLTFLRHLRFSLAISSSPDKCFSLVWAIFHRIPFKFGPPYHLIQPQTRYNKFR